MQNNVKSLLKENPNEALAFVIYQLEEAGVIEKGEAVQFIYPEPIQKAQAEGIDIFRMETLKKILNLKISGDPEQVLFTYQIKTANKTIDVPVKALEYLKIGKMLNQKVDV